MPSVAAIVVAAGRGLRVGGNAPKQYRIIGTRSVIRSSIDVFVAHPGVDAVQPVIHPDDTARFDAEGAGLALLPAVFGGATRQASVRAGLEALTPHKPHLVLVHDAARPFVSAALIDRAIAAAAENGAAVPVMPVVDTVKTVDTGGMVTGTVDRATLRTVQTPQAFGFAPLLDAHRRAQAAGREDFTDDAALAEWVGLKVATFEGEAGNVKLTTANDFARAEAAGLAALGDVRSGFGFDVHPFADADVVLHALVDAILGALSDGDIGVHFPPSDPQWRGASSDRFLAFAVERVRARGGRIAHLHATVVFEAPRVGPHRAAMRARIAAIAGIEVDRVAVKATTSERLGFTGRGEGIAAMATATVRLPWSAP